MKKQDLIDYAFVLIMFLATLWLLGNIAEKPLGSYPSNGFGISVSIQNKPSQDALSEIQQEVQDTMRSSITRGDTAKYDHYQEINRIINKHLTE